VRLDNTFLMVSAAHQTGAGTGEGARERLARAMADAAVSITITVLTDILSFGIGLATDFLVVQMFSLYTMVAISVTFANQLTLVMAVLALALQAEQSNRHSLLPCLDVLATQRFGESADSKSAFSSTFH